MTKPLAMIGHIPIPLDVLFHRFFHEALGIVELMTKKVEQGESLEPVVGTGNTHEVELYGWAPHVPPHEDQTGYVYLVPLNDGRSTLNVWIDEIPECVRLLPGVVVRLNDYARHWTEDTNPRVCAFLGSFDTPCDAEALAKLEAAITLLAEGAYYGAPRVREGFRVLLPDECIVANEQFDDTEVMLLADAKAEGRLILPCGKCHRPAVIMDDKWPYHSEMNRCIKHIRDRD